MLPFNKNDIQYLRQNVVHRIVALKRLIPNHGNSYKDCVVQKGNQPDVQKYTNLIPKLSKDTIIIR